MILIDSKWKHYLYGFGTGFVLSIITGLLFHYYYSRGVYALNYGFSIIEYAGLQFAILLPFMFAVSWKKYIAATILLLGFIIGNFIYINPGAEDNLNRSYFEFFLMLAAIAFSYVVSLVAQLIYSFFSRKINK